jgi:putative two-component system response regulator
MSTCSRIGVKPDDTLPGITRASGRQADSSVHGEPVTTARILVVDDQEPNTRLIESLLRREGYTHVRSLTDPRHVLGAFTEFQPDLVVLDLMMPHLDGFEIMDALRPLIPEGSYLPILVLTADVTPPTRQRALAAGAMDFLVKPFDPLETLLRIRNLLLTRTLHTRLHEQNLRLEDNVRMRTHDLEATRLEVLERLARAAEFRDDATGQHTHRVGRVAADVAAALGLTEERVELIRHAAPLHDVGKIGIPDMILLKPGRLSAEEFEVVKTHTTIGARILSGGTYDLLKLAECIALCHHELWDGSGYPRGIAGREIPLEARIVSVVDAFDAMTNDRPYRRALPAEEAWDILWEGAGRLWDADVVDAIASCHDYSKGGRDARADAARAVHR